MHRLVACPDCQRHVRMSEPACPFCGGDIAGVAPPPSPQSFGRLGRAAIFAFGVSAAGCGTTTTPLYGSPPADASFVDDGGPGGFDAAYGAPPVDAGVDAGPIAPAYGAPPTDAGEPDAGEPDAGSGPAPAYGASPAD